MPEEVIEAPVPAPALVSAVSEKLAPLPSKLPGAVSLSAVMPTSSKDAARLEYAAAAPSRPICSAPRCLSVVACVPVSWANGSEVVGEETSSTRYEEPATTGTLSVAAVVPDTTVAPVEPLTTSTCCPDHGLRTFIVSVVPAWMATVAMVPPSICTSTFEFPWMYTVPWPSQPDGQAGAIRSVPS
jgi:hypothetical protein